MIAQGYHIAYLGARMDIRTQLKMRGYELAMQEAQLTPLAMTTNEASSFSLGASLLQQNTQKYPYVDSFFLHQR